MRRGGNQVLNWNTIWRHYKESTGKNSYKWQHFPGIFGEDERERTGENRRAVSHDDQELHSFHFPPFIQTREDKHKRQIHANQCQVLRYAAHLGVKVRSLVCWHNCNVKANPNRIKCIQSNNTWTLVRTYDLFMNVWHLKEFVPLLLLPLELLRCQVVEFWG